MDTSCHSPSCLWSHHFCLCTLYSLKICSEVCLACWHCSSAWNEISALGDLMPWSSNPGTLIIWGDGFLCLDDWLLQTGWMHSTASILHLLFTLGCKPLTISKNIPTCNLFQEQILLALCKFIQAVFGRNAQSTCADWSTSAWSIISIISD